MINTKIVILAVLAVLIRATLFYNTFETVFQNKIDFVTPVTSYKRLNEGLYLVEKLGLSPYAGSVFAQPPLVVLPFLLPKKALQFLQSAVGDTPASFSFISTLINVLPKITFILCDLLVAWAIYGISRRVAESRNQMRIDNKKQQPADLSALEQNLPLISAAIYLLNPIMIASCISMSTVIFNNLAIALALYMALKGNVIASTFWTAAAAYLSITPAMLLVPVVIILAENNKQQSTQATTIKSVLFFVGWSAVLQYSSYVFVGRSWEFINSAYMFRLTASDLTPNWGNSWYFFTEVFEDFRPFFLYVFNAHIVAYIIPLTVYFGFDGVFLATIFTAIVSTFNFYPAFGDTFFYLTLLINYFHLARYMRYGFVVALLMMFAVVLGPVFFWAWVQQGTGNANFFYFITLLFCLAQVLLIVEFLLAFRRWHYFNVKPANSRKCKAADTKTKIE